MSRRRYSTKPGCLSWILLLYGILFAVSLLFALIDIYISKVFGILDRLNTPRNIMIAVSVLVTLLFIFIGWKVYEFVYYRSTKFLTLKDRIQKYIDDCNTLNQHIEELKDTPLGANQLYYGQSASYDNSRYHYRRPALRNRRYAPNVCNCSLSVLNNARQQPYKYICKYFNLPATEATLATFETVLNNFESAETGKICLQNEKQNILASIQKEIPLLIRTFSKKNLENKLGFYPIDFSQTYYPIYDFHYISAGGKSEQGTRIEMNIPELNNFILYLSQIVKFKKSAAGQRALMTSRLRQYILQRDNYTCQHCGLSIYQEPNLLLEIDHIIPISKGGLTTENNLRVLCWKCNRAKGSKMYV